MSLIESVSGIFDQHHKGLIIETWSNGVTTKTYNK
mgnify:CR=1 FL=1